MNINCEPHDPDVAFTFRNESTAPGAARRAMGVLFPQRDEFADDVSLVASELVSNVVLHTSAGGHLHAWDDDPLRLEVHDHDPTLPVMRRPAAAHDDSDTDRKPGGRGLAIVDGLTDDWGAEPDGDGKTIWAVFRRSPAGTAELTDR